MARVPSSTTVSTHVDIPIYVERTFDSGSTRHTTFVPSGSGIGEAIHKSRDGSHHTTPSHGWRPPTPYYGKKYRWQTKDSGSFARRKDTGKASSSFTTTWSMVTVKHILGSPPLGHLFTGADRKATAVVQQALERLSSNKVSLSLAFAERKKTAELVNSNAHRITKMFRALKRKYIQAHRIADIPGAWLEYRYAWLPLVYDVYDACEALEAADKGSYQRYVVTARASTTEDSNTRHQTGPYWLSPSDWKKIRISRSEFRWHRTQYKVRLDAHPVDDLYISLSMTGILDPVTLAWELLPYSFVADWFLGIGGFIRGLGALAGMEYLGGSSTLHSYWDVKTYLKGERYADNDTTSGWGQCYSNGSQFERSVLSQAPSSQLSLSGDLSFVHTLDLLALTLTRMKREFSVLDRVIRY